MHNLELMIFLAVVSTGIALAICANAQAVGNYLDVMDLPDHKRKRHGRPTPLVGGIAIIVSVVACLIAAAFIDPKTFTPLFLAVSVCGVGVALIGFSDDQSPITPLVRTAFLAVFLLTAFIVDEALNTASLNLGSFAPLNLPGWAFVTLMIMSSIGVVNAVNMADGQNGIVPGMLLVWLICLLLVTRDPSVMLVAALGLGPTLIVLIFNLQGKLFLGDCGTYGVTFVVGLLAMAVHAEGRLTVEMIGVWFFIPVMDCIRLIATRKMQGKSPFLGDRNHFHHRLQDKLGQRFGLATYVGTVAVTSLLVSFFPHLSLLFMTVLAAFYFSFAWLTDDADTAHAREEEEEKSGKLVAIRGGKSDDKKI